jgi:hypothetical protein
MDSTIFPFAMLNFDCFQKEALVLLESLAKRGRAHCHSWTQPTDWFRGKMGEQTAHRVRKSLEEEELVMN